MLRVTIEDSGENAVLRCVGRIVRGYESSLLCAAARQRGKNVVVDLTDVEAIDAAGVGALIALQAAGIYLQLLNPAPTVREVLHLTHLDTIFEVGYSSAEQLSDEARSQTLPNPMPLPIDSVFSLTSVRGAR